MNNFLITALIPLAVLVSYATDILAYLSNLPELFEDFLSLAGLVLSLPSFAFWFLFGFRYLRLVVHFVSFWCFYKPTPVPNQPTVLPQDCSVILPTIDPGNEDFRECIESCLSNYPGEIVIVTVGRNLAARTNQIVGPYRTAFPSTNIQVHFTDVANKRIQVAHGVSFAKGKVTILLDDHVFWRSYNFLATILAPFENDKVGAVGTNKRVRRTETGFNARSFWNMIGALYLERHNFEIRATNAIDGGVFVISGRTAAYRTSILKQPGFMTAFTNERFFFGRFGPLNADDDNFLTREVVARGYDIKIQYNDDAMIETTLGTYPKFLSQCLRWVRTTWRSNSASLFTDGTVWVRQPWCVYAVYLTSFVNFALFYDAALIYTLNNVADRTSVYMLLAWIFVTKMVKLTSYFLREPQDLLMLPGYFAFAYFHSLIKLYAGLTFWVTAWGGRNLDAINQGKGGGNDDNDDGSEGRDSDGQDPRRLSSGSLTSKKASSSTDGSDSTPRQFHNAPERALTPAPAPPQGWVSTPWGFVKNYALNRTPANVADTQLVTPGLSPTRTRSGGRGSTLTPFTFYRDGAEDSPITISCGSSSASHGNNNNVVASPSQVTYDIDDFVSPTRSSPVSPPSDISVVSIPPNTPSLTSTVSTHQTNMSSALRRPSVYDPVTVGGISPVPFPNHCPSPTPPTWPTLSKPSPISLSTSKFTPKPPSRYTFPLSPPTTSSTTFNSSRASSLGSNYLPSAFPGPTPTTTTRNPYSLSSLALARDRKSLGIAESRDKSWFRGKQCRCLHSDRDWVFKTRSCRCLVEDPVRVGEAGF